jgi:hypothetical protein
MAEQDSLDDRQMWGTGDLAVFLGGSEDSFTGLLMVLIAKADPENRVRLKLAFPRQVAAWELWQACSSVPTFAQMREIMAAADSWLDRLAKASESARLAKAKDVPRR